MFGHDHSARVEGCAPTDEELIRRLNLGGLIKDWGGFEKLVADLNSTGNVSVEHDVKLVGKSGAPRQIDVLIRHKQGLIEHLVVIDCKHWRSRVSRAEVDALANTVRELNASRGVLFSIQGFESGAITQAKADGIELFTVRELTDKEWGHPGRHIDFYLHVDALSIANFQVINSTGFNVAGPVSINLTFGTKGAESRHSIQPFEGSNAKTLEEIIIAVAHQAVREIWKPQLLFDGRNGVRKFWKSIRIDFNKPVVMPVNQGVTFIPAISFDLGISIDQSRFKFDRGAKYAFVLAVQDEVRGEAKAASRESGDSETILTNLVPADHAPEAGPVLENGSIMSVWLSGLFSFSELEGLEKGEYRDTLQEVAD